MAEFFFFMGIVLEFSPSDAVSISSVSPVTQWVAAAASVLFGLFALLSLVSEGDLSPETGSSQSNEHRDFRAGSPVSEEPLA